MKNLLLLIVLGSMLISCSSEEWVYSCDEEQNEWTKSHLSEIENMTRDQWFQVKPTLKHTVYAALTIDAKYNFWKQKFNEVLALEWTEEERNHILKLVDFITEHKDIFNGKISENELLYDTFQLFIYEWKEFAQEQLNWSNDLMFGIVASGYKMTDKKGNLEGAVYINTPKLKTRSESTTKTCDCNIMDDWCWGSKEKNVCMFATGCEQPKYNTCGALWCDVCNGLCTKIGS